MKIIKLSVALYVITILLATDIYAQEKGEIILGVVTSILPSPVWVAENKRYFQEEGLSVKIKEFGSGRSALKTMLTEGNLHMVTCAQTPVMFNSFIRNDYAIIAGMVYSDNYVKVLARQDKGITKALDLKGKKVGTTKGSTGHYFLGLFMVYSGISFPDVKVVDFEANQLTQALVDGFVEAISTWEPHIMNANKSLGKKAILLSSKGLFREDFYFVVRKDFINNNPDALKRFLKTINKAEEFIQKNKEEAINIVYQRLNLNREMVTSIWNELNFELFLDQGILTALEDEARWAIRNKLTDRKKVPNYLNFIYLDALQAVKPKGVTIIR
ncbi:MAG: ABC transporter substrate-binding protein [Deltaproteobacteria bacterium]|nr:ABC transporter substrate-binding protein [Deltaproteobacteria bacterium]MBM4324306.1 ABC transporter substrate-binding protein [Deltaproteobacteria bacterium]